MALRPFVHPRSESRHLLSSPLRREKIPEQRYLEQDLLHQQKPTTSSTVGTVPGVELGHVVQRSEIRDPWEAEEHPDDERDSRIAFAEQPQRSESVGRPASFLACQLGVLLLPPALLERLVASGSEYERDQQHQQPDDEVLTGLIVLAVLVAPELGA